MAGNLVAPEIPPTQNPVAPFLSAFFASAAINNKRRQLEDQLMQMQMRERLKDRELQDKETYYASLGNLRDAQALKDRAEAQGIVNKANKTAGNYERLTQLETAIDSIDSDQGTKDYRVKLNLLRIPFADILATKEGEQKFTSAWNRHTAVSRQIMGGQAAVVKDFHSQMKGEGMNPYWLENPDQWVYIDKSGKETSDPNKAVSRALKFTGDDKGNITPAPPSTDTASVKLWKTLPKDRFENLVKQHSAYKNVIDNIITGSQEPDTSAQPVQQPNQLSAEDQQALDWAQSNLNDPRANAIIKRLNVQ